MVLVMQQIGYRQAGAAMIGRVLSIIPDTFHTTMRTHLEERVRKIQITLGDAILDNNIEKEKMLLKQGANGRSCFCVH